MILDRQHDISFRHDTETPDHLLVSRTIRDEPAGFNFDWDAAAFQSVIAPRLHHYLPHLWRATATTRLGWTLCRHTG